MPDPMAQPSCCRTGTRHWVFGGACGASAVSLAEEGSLNGNLARQQGVSFPCSGFTGWLQLWGCALSSGCATGAPRCSWLGSELVPGIARCHRCHSALLQLCGTRRDLFPMGRVLQAARGAGPGAPSTSVPPGVRSASGAARRPSLCPSSAGTRASSRTAPAGSSTPPAFRRSTSSSSPSAIPPNSPPLFSTSSTRTK